MTFSALDSALLGPTFATAAMAELFSDRARLRQMLRIEAALARAEAQHGLVPEGLALAIEQISADRLDGARLGQEAAAVGIPVIPFVKAVQALLPPALDALIVTVRGQGYRLDLGAADLLLLRDDGCGRLCLVGPGRPAAP